MLVKRTEEYSEKFRRNLVFGYFDQFPTPQEAAAVYFRKSLPNDWDSCPECAVSSHGFNVAPEQIDGFWRVLLGESC